MTDGEKRLWSELKEFRKLYGLHARKQVPIGRFVVDFAFQQHKLVIDVDGEHHFTSEGLRRDGERDAWLGRVGYRVLRFNTGELSDSFGGCVEEILRALGLMGEAFERGLPPPLAPPLKGEGDLGVGASAGHQVRAGAEGLAQEFPSPLRGGVRGGGARSHDISEDI
jgi:very-short-patch-repair endonuclease